MGEQHQNVVRGMFQESLQALREAKAVAAVRAALEAAGGEPDDQLLLDSIEGETGLCEALDALLSRMRDTRILITGIAAEEEALEARRRRFEARLVYHKALIEQALMLAELERIERPSATLFLSRRAPKVEVQTEADIPAEFWKPGEPTLDKAALSAALKEGRAVPGACLSNAAPTLTVRTK